MAMVMGAMSVTASVNNSSGDSGSGAQSSSIVKAQEIRTTSPAKSTGLTSKHTLEVREFLQTQNNTPLYTNSTTPAKNLRNTFSSVITAANPVLFISQIVPLQQTPVTPVSDTPTTTDSTATDSSSATTPSGDNNDTATTGSGSDTTPATGDSDSSPPPEKTPPSGSGDGGASGNPSTLNMSQDPPPSSP